MSKILVIDYGWCNFHNLISMAECGHEVGVVTTAYEDFETVPTKFMSKFGIEVFDVTRDSQMLKLLPNYDILIATNPRISHLGDPRHHTKHYPHIEYLGVTRKSATIEFNKFDVRHSLERRGILVPPLMETPVAPFVVKPRVVPTPIDCAQICLDEDTAHHFFTKDSWGKHCNSDNCYYEEFLPKPTIETNVDFCIAKGKWSIRHAQEIIGEDVAKLANQFTHWTRTSSFKPLSDEMYEIAIENAEIILDWCVGICDESSYVGQITGLCTPDGDWYFCEINVRPEQTCSLPYFVTGDEYLEAMRGKPEILGDAFPKDVDKLIVLPNEPDSIYPYHLHEKYGVAIPCGLDIIDGEYRVSKQMRTRSKDERVGIVICDKVIPEGFIHEMNSEDFEITAKMIK